MKSKASRITLMAVLALIAVFGLLQIANAGDKFDASTTQAVDQITWYAGGTAITETTYYYGPSENGTTGQNVLWWSSGELVATVDLSNYPTQTQYFTITPQFSVDGSNWADATYLVEGFGGVGATYTHTYKSQVVIRRLVHTLDSTKLLAFPSYAKYMRLKAEVANSSYTVTPIFSVIMKNK